MGPPGNHTPQRSQELSIEDKQKVLDVITTLRTYQLLGIIEARNWIEKLFPEFGEVRDLEADEMFGELASATAGRERPESGNRRSSRPDPGNRTI